ncbi:MAG: tetratricopeptide repeat protein [Desulfobacterales bacterium]|nr:tetratricopeptide repeat protein [Desulfobacterales bacterium]
MAALIAAPLICVNTLGDLTNLPKALFVQATSLFLLVLWLGSGLTRRRLEFPATLPSIALLLLLAWGAVSFLWAVNEVLAFRQWMIWLSSWIFFVVLASTLRGQEQVQRLFFCVFAAGVMVAGLGLLQYFLGVDWVRQLVAPAATFGNKNMAAEFVVLAFPVAIGLFFMSRRPAAVAASSAGIILLASFIFHSFTKASWMAATAELLLMGIFLLGKRSEVFTRLDRQKKIAAVLVVFSLLFVSQLSSKGFEPRTHDAATAVSAVFSGPETEAFDTSLSVRLRYWENTGVLIADHLIFGVGLANFRVVYPEYQMAAVEQYRKGGATYYTHNDYLQIIAETGLIGLLLFFFVIGTAVYSAVRAMRNADTFRGWLLSLSSFAALAGIAVNAFFSFPLQLPAAVFYSAVFLAILNFSAVTAGRDDRTSKRAPTLSVPWHPAAGWTGLALGIMAFGVSLVHSHALVSADYYNYRMMAAISRKNWEMAVQHGQESLRRDPEHWKSRFLIGQALFMKGKYAEALESYRSFLGRYPNNYAALYNLGLVHQKLENNESAMKSYHRLLAMNHKHGGALANIAMIHGAQGDHETAFDFFSKAVAVEPENSNFHYNLGISAIHLKKYSQAESSLKRAVDLKPGYTQAIMILGRLYTTQKKYDDAVRMFENVLRIDPDQGQARRYLLQLKQATQRG